jgi:ribosomal protein S21
MAKNIKVTMDDLPKDIRSLSTLTKEGREKICRNLWRIFDGQVKKSGIMNEYKQKETFESPGEKKRRKDRESARERFKKQNKNKRQGN